MAFHLGIGEGREKGLSGRTNGKQKEFWKKKGEGLKGKSQKGTGDSEWTTMRSRKLGQHWSWGKKKN